MHLGWSAAHGLVHRAMARRFIRKHDMKRLHAPLTKAVCGGIGTRHTLLQIMHGWGCAVCVTVADSGPVWLLHFTVICWLGGGFQHLCGFVIRAVGCIWLQHIVACLCCRLASNLGPCSGGISSLVALVILLVAASCPLQKKWLVCCCHC